jgi:hypothetical protein
LAVDLPLIHRRDHRRQIRISGEQLDGVRIRTRGPAYAIAVDKVGRAF